MEDPNIADSNPVANEVQVDLHMLCPLMLNGVGGEIHGADVVAVDERALGERAMELSQELSKPSLTTPLATARYSASALERETTGCRLDDQETRLPPRKTRSRKWSGECPGSQPSQRRCRQPDQRWESGEEPSRSQQCHGHSGEDASMQ